MTAATVIGCLLLAFGPPLCFFLLVVGRAPKLVILSIGSGFFWLCGLFVSSVFWYSLVPLRPYLLLTVPVSVLSTNVFRYLFWLLWTKGQASLAQDAGKILTSKSAQFSESVAAGLGTGLTSSLVLFAGVLWNAWGPGVMASRACPSLSVYFVTAIMCLSWTVLHVLWTVLAFRGFYSGSLRPVLFVLVTHLALSLLTIVNSVEDGPAGLCAAAIVPQWVAVLLVSVVLNRNLAADYSSIVLKRQ